MNREVFDYLARKMRIDYEDDRRGDRRDRGDMRDGRRGRGGRGRGRGRRDYADYADYDDYNDYNDYADYADREDYGHEKPMRLSKSDMKHWKKMLENSDGSRGEHYGMEQITQIAQKMDIRFDEYSEKEFCMAVNMMYSDYAHVIKKYIPPERELHFCAELAKAFLEDQDGPEPSEKLALYYHCIVSDNTF